MAVPRLVIRTDRLSLNAHRMQRFCQTRRVELTAVTKGVAGSPIIAEVFIKAGIASLGDSRIRNLRRIRSHGVDAELYLIRSPVPSEVEEVITWADGSVNTEIEVIRRLDRVARRQGKVHSILLMVELGDLREGVGVSPSEARLEELSLLSLGIQKRYGVQFDRVSGGNSSNYRWMSGASDLGTINHIRMGESILLGCDSVTHQPLEGFETEAFSLVTEVIELKEKPVQGRMMRRAVVALGWQDVDVASIRSEAGLRVLGATSDHLVIDAGQSSLRIGDEVRFTVGYSGMMSAMTTPYVEKVYLTEGVA